MEQFGQDIGEFVHNVKNALDKLPVKNEGSKMKMIAELLEFDFKKARQKGYGHKEITEYLKSENLQMPAYLVKKYMVRPASQTNKQNDTQTDNGMDKKVVNAAAKGMSPMGNETGIEQANQQAKTSNDMDNQMDKTLDNPADKKAVNSQEDKVPEPLIKKGKFVIMPDTPDGEL